MKTFLIFILCFFMVLPAFAVIHPDEKLRDPAQEARALNLTKTLRCVVCQNESLEESQADIARDLRLIIRQQITAGKSDDQIIAFLRTRYGKFILLEPPMDRQTVLLWLAPVLVLATGMALAIPLVWRRRK
jgi:cytochrome c-type biogenesis protein CcmH